jgi:hypothetical protein
VRELAASGLVVLADKGYTGADSHIRTPYKGKNKPPAQKAANRAHATLRGSGERANAQLKTRRILRTPLLPLEGRAARRGHPRAPRTRDGRMKTAQCSARRGQRHGTGVLIRV